MVFLSARYLMPSTTGIIDSLLELPLPVLQQVLDTNGPFAAGDHVITQFHTGGAFLLPAGDHDTSGTYGVLVTAATIPIEAGYVTGFNGVVGGEDKSEDTHPRIAQLVTYRSLPITGFKAPVYRFDVHYGAELLLWPLATAEYIGLHVTPGFEVDLYWMCVL